MESIAMSPAKRHTVEKLCFPALFKLLIISVFLASGCSISPTHIALKDAELPRQIPVRDFVASTEFNGRYRVSPQGDKISWQGVSGVRPAIFWRDIPLDWPENFEQWSSHIEEQTFSKYSPNQFWASNNRHLLYHFEPSGDENSHVFAKDTEQPNSPAVDLTPYKGVKAYVLRVPNRPSDNIYVMHNRRDASIYDLYEINVTNGDERLLYQNNENSVSLLIDDEGNLRARVKQDDSTKKLQSFKNGQWQTLVSANLFDDLYPIDLDNTGENLYIVSNINRDKKVLQLLNLETAELKTIYEHETTDTGWARLSRKDRRLLTVSIEPDYPKLIYFDHKFEKAVKAFEKPGKHGKNIRSDDFNEQFSTIATWDHSGSETHLVDLNNGRKTRLGQSSERQFADVLVEQSPISIDARDGLQLKAFLSIPKIQLQQNKPLPTVLLVHGGPWARDWWGYNRTVQFFANRGYAVLQVNYRGSRGFGREYLFSAVGEFAGKMHDDLIDSVHWAIDQGISDPEKIAIVGGSYGGYATLVGMTMTPDEFSCGIDIVGVADLASLVEDFPPYWKPWLHFWHRFVGDPKIPEQRAEMDRKSPLNHAHKTKGPLLIIHGENDPRVKLDQSDRMVKALRAAGKDVEYIVIKDEGHGFRHWKNQLTLFREMEDFLAKCLGGRSSGFDYYQLGSWLF